MDEATKRVILKLMQQAMGCKVEWSEEEFTIMNSLVKIFSLQHQ